MNRQTPIFGQPPVSIYYMKSIAVALLLMFAMCGYVRATTDTVRHPNTTFAIRGKVLPWLIGGSGINYTLGAEYDFAKRQSIGIDLVYNDYSEPHDVFDSATQNYQQGPRYYTVARGLFVNYKYYFTPYNTAFYKRTSHSINKDYLPYICAFGRIGNLDLHYDPDYKTNEVSHDERHYSAGVLLGVVIGIFDINVGPYYKQKYVRSAVKNWSGTGIDVLNTNTSFIGARLGVNVMFVLKKSHHVLAEYYKRNAE